MLKRNCIRIITVMIMLVLLTAMGTLAVSAEETSYGSAGVIMDAQRNPEQGDTSNWLTIQSGDAGVRVVNNEGREIVAVDNYGGIYLNGDVYLNQQLLKADMFQIANGFIYLLLVISLIMNVVNFFKIRRLERK